MRHEHDAAPPVDAATRAAPKREAASPGAGRAVPVANLLDLTHDALFVRGIDGVIEYWNRAAEELYGWTAHEALGRRGHELLQTDFPEPLAQIEAELRRTGRWEGELVHSRKDGTRVIVATRWSLQRDETGAPIAILQTSNDITGRKRAEEAERDSEELWRATFESNPTMYFMVDEAGRILHVNAFGASQLGYEVAELVGQPVLDVFLEADKEMVRGNAERCFQHPGEAMRWEARKIRKDGTMLWVRETARAVQLRKQLVLLVVCEDITERKRIRDELHASEERFRALVQFSFDVYWESDENHRFVRQEFGADLLDAPRSGSELGKTRWEIPYLEPGEDAWRKHRETMDAHLPFRDFELARPTPDGGKRYVSVSGLPVFDEAGRFLGYRGVGRHINERKRAEALLAGEKRILEMVARGESLSRVLDALCRFVEELAPEALTSILLIDGEHLRHGGAPSLPKAYTDAIDGVLVGPRAGSCGTAAYRGEQVIVSDIATDPLWTDFRGAALPHSLRACWSTPVFSSEGKVIATFAMYYREPRSPGLRDQEIVEQITHLAGVAIQHRLAVDRLRESEKELRDAIETIPAMVFAMDASGTTAVRNRRWVDYSGLPAHGPAHTPDLVHPEDAARYMEARARSAETGEPFEEEARFRRTDGVYRWFLVRAVPLRDESGKVRNWYGIATDIEDRKRADQALRRSEAYLAEAQKVSHTGSWAARPGIRDFTYLSEELMRILGLETGSARGLDREDFFSRIVHPDDSARIREGWGWAWRGKAEFSDEFRIVWPDGTTRHVHGIGHPILDEAGELVEIVGTVVDVTERKRTEEERAEIFRGLQESEARFRTFVDFATDALMLHGDDGRVVDANRQACEGLGYGREELIGMTPLDFDPDIDLAAMQRLMERVNAGEVLTLETRHRRKDGTTFPVEVRARSLPPGGRATTLSLTRDITGRKRAEADKLKLEERLRRGEKMEAIGRFASGIAHDFNNILGGIIAYGEMLFDDAPGDDPRKRYAQNVLAAATRGRDLVGQILAFTRGQRGKRAPTDLCRSVAEALELVRSSLPEAVTLRPAVPETPLVVMGDATQLHQVVMNLCSNAVHAMAAGGALRVAVDRCELAGPRALSHGTLLPGSYACVRVDDSGCGMDPATLARIFEPFFTTKEVGRGTGLGLALVYAIVTDFGGAIDVKSAPGEGSTFAIHLPLAASPARAVHE